MDSLLHDGIKSHCGLVWVLPPLSDECDVAQLMGWSHWCWPWSN